MLPLVSHFQFTLYSCRHFIRPVASYTTLNIHNILQCCQRRTKSQLQATSTENLVIHGIMFTETCSWTYRQTDMCSSQYSAFLLVVAKYEQQIHLMDVFHNVLTNSFKHCWSSRHAKCSKNRDESAINRAVIQCNYGTEQYHNNHYITGSFVWYIN